jgi:hypothetical protein
LSSGNILNLKALLKDGWKIRNHKVSIVAAANQEKVHLVLEKEGKKTFMKVANDGEFTEYTFHFQKFEDGYGNYEFIYIEDLKGYNERIEELNKKGAVPARPYEISIGDVYLKDVHLDHLLIAGSGGPHVSIASFFVPLERNPEFYQVDFRDEVVIKWVDKDQVAFKGFAHEVSCNEWSAVLLCYGGTRRLFQDRLTLEFIAVRSEYSLYFVTTLSGLKPQFHGMAQPELSRRVFKAIFPIGGLTIPCNFKVEQVVFTKDISKELPEKVSNAKTLSKPPWNVVSAFAITNVESEHYFEALKKAEETVKRAVDWIQFRTDITVPSIRENETDRMLSYNMSKSYSKCFLIPYGLAIDSKTGGAIFLLLNEQSGHGLVFNYDPNSFFEPFAPLWEKLEQLGKTNRSGVQPLYEALSWFIQTFEVESPTDNLLQLWMAFEFLCSGQRVPHLVDDTSIDSVISSIRILGLSKAEEEAIIRNVKQVNNPILMAKWENLLERLGITLSTQENRLISRLRTERNDIVHGKKTGKLSMEDIEKFRSVLERVFLAKATQLINSSYGIPDLGKLFSARLVEESSS